MDDARPAWNENAPPLSNLILEASQRNLGDDLLDPSRKKARIRKFGKNSMSCKERG
jgi:hypothetical protein